MWGHWPEWLLVALFLVGGIVPLISVPVGWPFLLLLVPVGWILAFGAWVGIIWLATKLHDQRTGNQAKGGSEGDR
jgi:hypothetical protein